LTSQRWIGLVSNSFLLEVEYDTPTPINISLANSNLYKQSTTATATATATAKPFTAKKNKWQSVADTNMK
jgi:hypothetical protein